MKLTDCGPASRSNVDPHTAHATRGIVNGLLLGAAAWMLVWLIWRIAHGLV